MNTIKLHYSAGSIREIWNGQDSELSDFLMKNNRAFSWLRNNSSFDLQINSVLAFCDFSVFHHSRKSTRLELGNLNSNFRSVATYLMTLDKSVNLSEPRFLHL